MSKGYLKGWIVVRLLVVLCLLMQTVVPVIAQEPIPVEEPQLPPADPEDLIVEPWEDNGLGPAMDIDPVVTLEPSLTLPEQASSVSELIPPGFTTTQAVTSTNGMTETAVITPTGGVITPTGGVISSLDSQRILTETGMFTGTAVSFLSGQLTLIAPDGAFTQGVTITLQPITATGVITRSYAISDSAGSPITVTQRSYEFFRFELEATRLSDGQPVATFDKPVHLVLDMRGIVTQTTSTGWYITYQDENDPSTRHHPYTKVHDDTGLVSVSTNHFSGWSAGNEPLPWRYRWNVPAVSTFTGAATFQYPIELPAGRGGLTPNIDIAYSSRGVDSLIFTDDMDQGPLGLGWGINNIEISRANIEFEYGDNNVFVHHGDRFSLVLNGASYELERYGGDGESYADYYAVNGPGLRIQQVYDPVAALNQDHIYWTVKTPDGTTYRLGFTEESETGQSTPFPTGALVTDGTQLAGSVENYGGIRWRVDTVTDIHGNQIQYEYQDNWEEWSDLPGEAYYSGNNLTSLVTDLTWRTEIRYNYVNLAPDGLTRVTGTYASKITFSGARVEYISLYHVDLNTPYRRIHLDLGGYEHDNGYCGQLHRHTVTEVVNSITEENANGSILRASTVFTYTQGYKEHKPGQDECFLFKYLEQVDNGYGGRVEFTYAGDGRIHPEGWEQLPEYGQSFFVTQTETWDGIHSQPAVTEYEYEFPCYDQESGDQGDLPDPENCPSRIGSGQSGFSYGNGPLVGFAKTTMTAKDYGGTAILSRSISEFWLGLDDDRILQGRPYSERFFDPVLDPNDTLALQETNTSYDAMGGETTDTYHFIVIDSVSTVSSVFGGSLTRQVDYDYDQYGNVTYAYERGDTSINSDDRHLHYDYFPNTSTWIVNKVARERIYGPGTTPLSNQQTETRYYYDSSTTYNTAPTKGNLKKVEQAVTLSPRVYITTQSLAYDATYSSNVTEIADGNVHTTTITYDSTFKLLPVTVDSPEDPIQTFQYYGFGGVQLDGNQAGLLKKVTDANNDATEFRYDPFGRLERVIRPDDTFSSPSEFYRYYDYTGFRLTAGPVMILSWRKTQDEAGIGGTGGVWERLFFDGLGRTIQTQTPYTDWEGSGEGQQIHLDTVYNATGQALSQSVPYLKPAYERNTTGNLINNPYVSPDSVAQVVTQYNAAGQPVRSVGLDGAVSSLLYGRQVSYAQDGNNHTKVSFFTAHGQLWSVDELVGNFRDTFGSSGSLDDWTETAGVAVSSGAAHLTNSGSTTYMYRDLEEASSQDVAVTFSFYSSDEDLDAWLNLHDGSGASYRGWGLRVYEEDLYLEKKSGATVNQTLLMPFKPNTWYRLLLRNSKSGSRSLALLVWEENNPDIMAEIRELPAGSSWHTDNWRFQANVYSNGTTLDLDNYDEYDVNRTIYTYDPVGNLTQVTPPTGPVTTIGYDNIGRKTTMTDPDMGTWTYEYDNAGNLISQTDNKDEEIVFTYDELNRLVEKSHDSVTLAEYFYDETAGVNGIGRRTSMTAYDETGAFSNSASWTYDARGRAITEQRIIDVGGVNKTYNFTYGYTEGDLPVTMTYPGNSSGGTGESVTTHYWWQTAAPKSLVGDYWVVGSYGTNTGATYTASGQLNTLRLGNDVVTTYGYDPAYRINTIVNSPVYQDLDYDYDKAGNVTKITDYNFNYPAEEQAQVFSYDSLNRLTAACTLTTINGTTCTNDSDDGHYDEEYSYDVLGNLTSKAGVTLAYTSTLPHAVTGLDGVGHFEYDDNGNMIERDDGSAIWDYTWTVDNRLATATDGTTTVTFTYDADGNMVLREEGSAAKVYLGKLYQHELPADTETKHFLFGGQLVAQREDSGSFNFFLTDHLGGTNITVDAIGDVEANVRYGPWGNERWANGTTPTEYQYTGQRADTTLGIYDYRARYYDPSIGHFLSADTIVPNPANPQSYNRYSYVSNNPLRYIDPTGHGECDYDPLTCTPPPPPPSPRQQRNQPQAPTATYPVDELEPSEEILDYIRGFESIERELYNDPAGHCSIGIGVWLHDGPCSYDPNKNPEEAPYLVPITDDTITNQIVGYESVVLTDHQIEQLFRNKVKQVGIKTVRDWITVELTQRQFDALVSLGYNVPDFVYGASLHINEGEFVQAAEYIRTAGEWQWLAEPQRYGGLKDRRAFEANYFLSGSPQP